MKSIYLKQQSIRKHPIKKNCREKPKVLSLSTKVQITGSVIDNLLIGVEGA